MTKLPKALLAIGLLSLLGLTGQTENDQSDQSPDIASAIAQALLATAKPSTKLEEIVLRKNAVIVKGFTPVASVPGEDGASLQISAAEVQDLTNNNKEYGLVINVVARQRASTAYIDYDEIDALGSACDYLQKVDKTATAMANLEVQYRSRGDLWLNNYNDNGARMVAIRTTHVEPAGQITSAIAYFRAATLGDVRQQIAAAKQMLDKLRG